MIKVIYVNHKAQQCGVYEFGKDIGLLLETSKKFKVTYVECDSFSELKKYYRSIKPDIILYNFHPATMDWINRHDKYQPYKTYYLDAVHIGMIHEVYQEIADSADGKLFDFHIAPDPTLLLKNPLVYKTGRLLPGEVKNVDITHVVPVVGSFGFATANKGFETSITLVQNEFDEAVINLNIPYAKFGDDNGENARRIAQNCRDLITKKGIILNIDHSYLERNELLTFLSKNTINIFLYDNVINRGISSATDWALASGRPLGISKSTLFRHLLDCNPSICIADNSLKTIIDNGVMPIKKLYREYGSDVVLWDYERILNSIIERSKKSNFPKKTYYKYYKERIKEKLGFRVPQRTNYSSWAGANDDHYYAGEKKRSASYQSINKSNKLLNRILDNSARAFYQPAIDFFFENLPDLIEKKIPEANVQQAFVFDTVVEMSKKIERPKILAVGAFEDTAAEGLKLLNYNVDFIDPLLNYDIETFITKPNVQAATYDIIISTSVIEHVEKDEKFIQDIAYLLKKGGYGILTCDYNDQYKKGDNIPAVDFRFYTQHDLRERLMKAIPDCELVGVADWNCENPDFCLSGIYNYTFASLVFYKKAE